MATIALDVKINALESANSLKDLKQGMKDLKNELAGLDEGSAEFKKVSGAIAGAKDKMDDLNDAINAETGAGKFQAIAKFGSAIAGGFAAAQGAMAMFGGESEELQKTLVKIQGAMAFAEGLSKLEDLGNAFKNAKTVAVDAFKGMSAAGKAFMATGIGLAIAAIAVAMKLMQDAAEQAKMEVENLEKSIESLGQLQSNEAAFQTEIHKKRISELKLQGANEQELLKAEKEGLATILNARIKNANETIELNTKLLNNQNASDEQRAKATAAIFKAETEIQKVRLEADTAKTEFLLKQQEIDKKAQEKAEENAKKSIELSKELNQKLAELRIENMDDEREQAKAKENLDYENQVKEYKTKYAGKKELNNLLYELENKHLNALSEIDNKFNIEEDKKKKEKEEKTKAEAEKKRQEDLAGIKKDQADQLSEYETRIKTQQRLGEDSTALELEAAKFKLDSILNDENASYEQRLAAQEEYDGKVKEIDDKSLARKKAITEAGINLVTDSLNLISAITTEFAGKDEASQRKAFEINKKVQLALATIDMIKGVQSAFTSAQASPFTAVFPGYPYVQAAMAAAYGVMNIRKISQTQFETGGGAGGGMASAGGGAGGAMSAPLQGGVNNTSTQLANLAQGTQEQKPIKAYVLQTDIASEDQKMKAIENKSKIE